MNVNKLPDTEFKIIDQNMLTKISRIMDKQCEKVNKDTGHIRENCIEVK